MTRQKAQQSSRFRTENASGTVTSTEMEQSAENSPVSALREHGFVVLKGHFPNAADYADEARGAAEQGAALAKHAYGSGQLSVFGLDNLAEYPGLRSLMTDERLVQIVRDYFQSIYSNRLNTSEMVVNRQVEVEHNSRPGTTKNSGWHFDRMPTIKAAVFLTPATARNGGMEIIPKTHHMTRPMVQRQLTDNPNPMWLDNFPEFECPPPRIGLDADIGDVILFDTLLLHRGGTLRSGERIVIRGVSFPPIFNGEYLAVRDEPVEDFLQGVKFVHPYERSGPMPVNPSHMFRR